MRLYKRKEESWRTIDDDWLMQAEALALFLNTFTNNSSLVLAIELVESKKVLLFAADARTGNWLSRDKVPWADKNVSTNDLLARTVFYKVGHHASRNATLVAGSEKMKHPDLVAFIPVQKQDPNITKENGWKMLAEKLLRRLKEKTNYRVLQMDGDNPPECNPTKEPAKSSWAKNRNQVENNGHLRGDRNRIITLRNRSQGGIRKYPQEIKIRLMRASIGFELGTFNQKESL